MPNQLIHENSPYLLQHAHNPVDWFPWGLAALEKARAEDKPIFLSIGYAACHWCHVMAHESFENPATAALMNANFVNIKVDREERPDLDDIYMQAVVAMTGQGGWPMSVFLTPDLQPFFGGTYFPPMRRYNLPSFQDVLSGIADAWQEDRQNVLHSALQLTAVMQRAAAQAGQNQAELDSDVLSQASGELCASQDAVHGGWGGAPKFPQPMAIEFLLQQSLCGNQTARETALNPLRAMQRGGIFDVVGGGFHRYSTSADWLIPHFEKMLYDNAQLARVYLHAWQVSGNSSFLDTCTRTLDWMLSEMRHPAGPFFASLDADSAEGEGSFYTWTQDELTFHLSGEDFDLLRRVYPLPSGGNFEERLILQRAAEWETLAGSTKMDPENLQARCRKIQRQLFAARTNRPRPHTDDKVITAWNALAIEALAEAGRALGRADYLRAAQKAACFILDELRPAGQLMRTWREGKSQNAAALEDYAAMILALLSLYQSDFDPAWYQAARELAGQMLDRFDDPAGGFFDAPADAADLLFRPRNVQDNATPSGNALAALSLLRLSEFDGQSAARNKAEQWLASMQSLFAQAPLAFAFALQAVSFSLQPSRQAVLVWPAGLPAPAGMQELLQRRYDPGLVLAGGEIPLRPGQPPLLHNRPLVNGQPAVYLCEHFTCRLPLTDPAVLKDLLQP